MIPIGVDARGIRRERLARATRSVRIRLIHALWCWLFLAVSFSAVAARTWTILPDGSGDAPTIQEAIAASSHHDTVLVMPGTYQENLRFLGKKIAVGSLYLRDPDPAYIEQTVVDGSTNWSSVVQFVDAEEPASVLCGLTLTGGHGTQWGWPYGGGILVYGSSPTLRHLIVRENLYAGVDEYGGGMAILYGSPLVERCIVEDNEAYTGGAFDIEGAGSNPLIRDSVIRGNRARISCAVDVWNLACPRFERTSFESNMPIGQASAIEASNGSRIDLVSVTLADNGGHALKLWYDGAAVVANSILWENPAPQILVDATSELTLAYTDIQGGAAGVAAELGSVVNWLGGNIDANPLFVDPGTGDYRLQPASPCVNAGTAHLEWDGRTIVDLAPGEYCGGAPEMGAFELCPDPVPVPDGPGAGGGPGLARLNVAPNPSRGGVTIRFAAERAGPVEVGIVDVTGRRVRTLRATGPANRDRQIRWQGCDDRGRAVPSGVYWAIVRVVGEPDLSRRFIVTR